MLASHKKSSHVSGFSSGSTAMSYSSRPTEGLPPASGGSEGFAGVTEHSSVWHASLPKTD